MRVGLRPGQEFFFVLQTSKEFWFFFFCSVNHLSGPLRKYMFLKGDVIVCDL